MIIDGGSFSAALAAGVTQVSRVGMRTPTEAAAPDSDTDSREDLDDVQPLADLVKP